MLKLIYILFCFYCITFLNAIKIDPKTPSIIQKSITKSVAIYCSLFDTNGQDWSRDKAESEYSRLTSSISVSNGLQFKVLTGNQPSKAHVFAPGDKVEISFVGFEPDGKTFHNTWSDEKNTVFNVDELPDGWVDALKMMSEGDVFQFYIPARRCRMKKKVSPIPENTAMIVFIELVSFSPPPPFYDQAMAFMQQDLYKPYVKVYHIFVMTGYLLFRYLSKKAIDYFLGEGNRPQANASHILFEKEDKKTCDKVFKQLSKDSSLFAEMAEKHSKCPSGKNGGKLGWFKKGAMVPEFDKVIFNPSVAVDKVQAPILTQFGHHIIVVHDRKNFMSAGEEKKQQ